MMEQTYPILEKRVDDALRLLLALREQLKQEAIALQQPQTPEIIGEIAHIKKQLVGQLELFNTHCGQILATESLPNNQAGLAEYFLRAEQARLLTRELVNNWANIQSLSLECRALNDQNGAGIALLSRHTERALQILKGKPDVSHTYGPDGAKRSELYTRTLISV